MAQSSLIEIAAGCGVRPNMSVLQDVMVHRNYQTKSLREALAQMAQDCTIDPDTQGNLLALSGSATITALQPDVSGLLHTITLKLTITNLTDQAVDASDSATIFLTDSGGFIL